MLLNIKYFILIKYIMDKAVAKEPEINKLEIDSKKDKCYVINTYINNNYSQFLNRIINNNYYNSDNFSIINFESIIFSRTNILHSFESTHLTRLLQNYLKTISIETVNYIICNLQTLFRQIIKNKNGNYFCTDLIKRCNLKQRIVIINELKSYLYDDCCNQFATHTLQNIIDNSTNELEFKLLICSFNNSDKIIKSTLNKYGNYVISKLIVHIPEEFRIEFNLLFVKNIDLFSRDQYGLLVAKQFVNHTKNKEILFEILYIVLTNIINIANNKFGNYFIQFLLKKWWDKKEGVYLKNIIKNNFKILSENKFSMFVCNLFKKLNNGL